MLSVTDIEAAYRRIQPLINKTNVMTSRTLNNQINAEVFLKCENFQRAGAFKFRGVCNKLLQLSDAECKRGVITHSSGNHAQALALAAHLLGIQATIVMPKNAPRVKVEATTGYGATIVWCENTLESREKTCTELIRTKGYTLIHPYNDDQIIAGAGTVAYELIQEIGPVDYMVCPIGGGGLTSGTSIAIKGLCPDAHMIAVEPEQADDAYKSFHDHKLHPSVYPDTIADGLRTALCKRTLQIIEKNVDDIILVSEQEIIAAMRFLFMRMKLVVEPSGAVALAGVFKIKKQLAHKKVGIIISGGNVDLDAFFEHYQKKLR